MLREYSERSYLGEDCLYTLFAILATGGKGKPVWWSDAVMPWLTYPRQPGPSVGRKTSCVASREWSWGIARRRRGYLYPQTAAGRFAPQCINIQTQEERGRATWHPNRGRRSGVGCGDTIGDSSVPTLNGSGKDSGLVAANCRLTLAILGSQNAGSVHGLCGRSSAFNRTR